MAKILIAASTEPRAILQRILAGHDLACAETMAEAETSLRERTFDLIICTILFDESRMFDFLRLTKSRPEWQPIPFVCARMKRHTIDSRLAREAIAFTCQALGAAAFLNITDYEANPEQEIRQAIECLLKAPSSKNAS